LGLLEHNLGNPYPIRTSIDLPRQIISSIYLLPFNYTVAESSHRQLQFYTTFCEEFSYIRYNARPFY